MTISSFSRLKLKSKMLLILLSVVIALFLSVIITMGIRMRESESNNSIEIAKTAAQEYASIFQNKFENALSSARTIANMLEGLKAENKADRQIVLTQLKSVLDKNTDFVAVRTVWEPNEFDSNDQSYISVRGHDATGRFVCCWDRTTGILRLNPSYDYESTGSGNYYNVAKQSKQECIIEPYYYSYSGSNQDRKLITSLVVPIFIQDKFVGIISIDLLLNDFQALTSNIKVGKRGYGSLISNRCVTVTYPNIKKIVKTTDEMKFGIPEVVDAVKIGKPMTYRAYIQDIDKEAYKVFEPIVVGNTQTPWSFYTVYPIDEIMSSVYLNLLVFLLYAAIALAVITYIIYRVAKEITTPILKTTDALKRISRGEIHDENKVFLTWDDELGEMAKALNSLIVGLMRMVVFAKEIGESKFDSEFESLGKYDILGNSLLEMRTSLHRAKIEETERKREDEQHRWLTNGLAHFNNILRKNYPTLEDLCDEIVRNLMQKINCTQIALFVLNNENPEKKFLELKSAYAYNFKRYIENQILLGEGLIGACALEKKTIHLDEVPDSYLEINSGFGKAKPQSLLIVPIKVDNVIFGIIELSSLENFVSYQIDFIEKIADNIGLTLNAVKINEQTNLLLTKTRRQSEELAAHEEEMRQNLEELQATQEERDRSEAEINSMLKGLNAAVIYAEYDMEGKLLEANNLFLSSFRIKSTDIGYIDFLDIIPNTEDREHLFNQIWNNIRSGSIATNNQHFVWKNQQTWISETYAPILDAFNQPYKVLCIGTDISELKNKENEFKKMNRELKQKQLESLNIQRKLEDNAKNLNSAIEDAKMKEIEIQNQNQELSLQRAEMKQIMDDLQKKNNEFVQKQAELETISTKLKSNEDILKNAMEKSREKNKKIEEQNNALLIKEAELNERIELLEMNNKQQIENQLLLQKAKQEIEANQLILNSALQESQLLEIQLKENNNILTAHKEELTKNIEELNNKEEIVRLAAIQRENDTKVKQIYENEVTSITDLCESHLDKFEAIIKSIRPNN